MSILSHQADIDPDHWDTAGSGQRTSVQLSVPMKVNYPDGTTDSITAGVAAILDHLEVANTNQASGDIQVGNDTTETIVTGLDLTIVGYSGAITINWDVWFSMNHPFVVKQGTVRIRRDNTSGAILTSHIIPDTGDSTAGHSDEWTGTFVDSSPTTGHYVMTIQNTAASVTTFWTNQHVFDLSAASTAGTVFDRTKDVYVLYTIKGSNILRAMKEADFITTFGS